MKRTKVEMAQYRLALVEEYRRVTEVAEKIFIQRNLQYNNSNTISDYFNNDPSFCLYEVRKKMLRSQNVLDQLADADGPERHVRIENDLEECLVDAINYLVLAKITALEVYELVPQMFVSDKDDGDADNENPDTDYYPVGNVSAGD